MNEERITEPLELDESALYAVAGGKHIGSQQILPNIRTSVDIDIIFVNIGNNNRVMGSRGKNSGSTNASIANGNEIIIYA